MAVRCRCCDRVGPKPSYRPGTKDCSQHASQLLPEAVGRAPGSVLKYFRPFQQRTWAFEDAERPSASVTGRGLRTCGGWNRRLPASALQPSPRTRVRNGRLAASHLPERHFPDCTAGKGQRVHVTHARSHGGRLRCKKACSPSFLFSFERERTAMKAGGSETRKGLGQKKQQVLCSGS